MGGPSGGERAAAVATRHCRALSRIAPPLLPSSAPQFCCFSLPSLFLFPFSSCNNDVFPGCAREAWGSALRRENRASAARWAPPTQDPLPHHSRPVARRARAHTHARTPQLAKRSRQASRGGQASARRAQGGVASFGRCAPTKMEPPVAALADLFAKTLSPQRVRPPQRITHRPAAVRRRGALIAAPFPARSQEIGKSAEQQLEAASLQPGYAITVLKVRNWPLGGAGRAPVRRGRPPRFAARRRAPRSRRWSRRRRQMWAACGG